jgi:flagellar biosynthesis/type III secretory pathway protein FliH
VAFWNKNKEETSKEEAGEVETKKEALLNQTMKAVQNRAPKEYAEQMYKQNSHLTEIKHQTNEGMKKKTPQELKEGWRQSFQKKLNDHDFLDEIEENVTQEIDQLSNLNVRKRIKKTTQIVEKVAKEYVTSSVPKEHLNPKYRRKQ